MTLHIPWNDDLILLSLYALAASRCRQKVPVWILCTIVRFTIWIRGGSISSSEHHVLIDRLFEVSFVLLDYSGELLLSNCSCNSTVVLITNQTEKLGWKDSEKL